MQIEAPLVRIDGSLTAREGLVKLETQNQRAYRKVNNVCALPRALRFNSVTERERSQCRYLVTISEVFVSRRRRRDKRGRE